MKLRLFLNLSLVLALSAPLALAKPKAPPAPPPPGPPTDADWRTPDPDNILVIETTKGRILVELNPTAAPVTVARVKQLARDKVYDGRAFFRVLDNFMDQTGDPLDSGVGQSSLPNIGPEFTFRRGADTPFIVLGRQGGEEEGLMGSLAVMGQTLDLGLLTVDHKVNAWGAYCAGTVGMARSDDPSSENSQFFLMRTDAQTADHGTHQLDKAYTALGRVIVGQDVVDAVKVGTGEEGQVDPPQDKMLSVTVLADIPEATRPKVRIIDPASAWMKAEAAREQADQGPDYTVCDLHIPARVD